MSKESLKKWQEENKEYIAEYKRRVYVTDKEARKKYRKKYLSTEKGKAKKKEQEERAKKKYLENPINRIRTLLRSAQRRASIIGMDYDLSLRDTLVVDMDTNCPCCGVLFDYTSGTGRRGSNRNASPSLDRVDNTIGYTSANVVIICTRCNLLKSTSTLIDLNRLVQYVFLYGNETAVENRRVKRELIASEKRKEKETAFELAAKIELKPLMSLTAEERHARRLMVNEERRLAWAAMSDEERRSRTVGALSGQAVIRKERFKDADWTLTNIDIARQLGVSSPVVSKMRKTLGMPPSPKYKVPVK